MFDWIPLEYYTLIQYHALFVITLIILFHAIIFDIKDDQSINFFYTFGYIVVIAFMLYMGTRPISSLWFGDMGSYAEAYKLLQGGAQVKIEKDYLFNYFMKLCSEFIDVYSYFLLLAILYLFPYFLFSKKYFGRYWFFAMFMFLSSFSFWAYGTNGIRNGLAASFFILGLYYYHRKYWMYICFTLSYFMHASLIVPIAAFIVSGIYKNPKIYLYIWLLAIPLSLVGGSSWMKIFSGLGFENRTEGYFNNEKEMKVFSQTGFRWDFLVYSASAVFAGAYFILKKKINDTFYIHLYGIYCISNAFWILLISAAYSNRFAYLSWFLMPSIIAYPMFRYKIWKEQYKIFAAILFVYFMFTYYMFVLKLLR